MLAGFRSGGGDAPALLHRAGLEDAVLRDASVRLPIGDYAALYNALVAEMRDEGFGLFAAPVPPGTFEFLCRGVLSSRTLGEALERAARFMRIALPDLAISVTRGPTEAFLAIRERRH